MNKNMVRPYLKKRTGVRSTKLIFFIFLCMFLLGGITSGGGTMVYAAPAFHQLVVNEKEKKCARFFPGDECVSFILPDGWKREAFITEVCGIDENCQQKFENYCSNLGFKYVGYLKTKSIETDCPFRHGDTKTSTLFIENLYRHYKPHMVLFLVILTLSIVGIYKFKQRTKK